MTRIITPEQALAALEDMDDFARMEASIEPIGAYRCLAEFIKQAGALRLVGYKPLGADKIVSKEQADDCAAWGLTSIPLYERVELDPHHTLSAAYVNPAAADKDDFNEFTNMLRTRIKCVGPVYVQLRDGQSVLVTWHDDEQVEYSGFCTPDHAKIWRHSGISITSHLYDMVQLCPNNIQEQ